MSIVANDWIETSILITVKTYPTHSKKYQETVCTAGITEKHEWIRIYPVRYRFLENNQQYKKYSWIQARIKRNIEKDFRPDSFRIDESSIRVIRKVDTSYDWRERNQLILPTVSLSIESLKRRYQDTGHSLGIFRPKKVIDFICEPDPDSARAKPHEFVQQLTLFGVAPPKDLKPVPYKFSYHFLCDDPDCKGHKMIILDWELYAAYFYFKRKYREQEVLKKIREKWLSQLCGTKVDTHFIVGTQYPNPTFMILGVYWPPKTLGFQTTLF